LDFSFRELRCARATSFFFSFLAASDGGGKPPGGVTRLDYHVCTFIYDFFKKEKIRKI
jgi:hypothetical protein